MTLASLATILANKFKKHFLHKTSTSLTGATVPVVKEDTDGNLQTNLSSITGDDLAKLSGASSMTTTIPSAISTLTTSVGTKLSNLLSGSLLNTTTNLTTLFSNQNNQSISFAYITQGATDTPLSTGEGVLISIKNASLWGQQIAIMNSHFFNRAITGSSWSSWSTLY